MTPNVTIFRNIKVLDTPFHRPISVVYDRIREGKSKELVKSIRDEDDKQKRSALKMQLPAICFSGEFTKRYDNSLTKHSGYVCLDFDGYEGRKELMQDKERFSKDKHSNGVFISPSGKGLKVIVKIPADPENHVNYFNSLKTHFDSKYFDRTSKNLSRVCYESFDAEIYVNENSSLWNIIEEPEYKEVTKYKDAPTFTIKSEEKIVEILVKWWKKKYPMVEGERNANTYILARAFNEYGIAKSLAGYILKQFISEDFTEQEIDTTIESAYKLTADWHTKFYEDEDAVNLARAKLKRGVSKKEVRIQFVEESNLEGDVVDAVLGRLEEEQDDSRFWTKDKKGQVKINHHEFKGFLEKNGFYKYCPEGGKNFVFIKMTNNLIDHTSEKEMKDFILTHLEEVEEDDLSIYNYFADQTRFFREEFLTLLKTIEVFLIEDSLEAAYLYYSNCAVKVTISGVTQIDYIDLNGYVWKEHIIDRKYNPVEDLKCDYKTFISRICGDDPVRVKTMESTIGYLLHGHKSLSDSPAVILNDEVISDNPEGGTGKGLFMTAIAQLKKVVTIDGKQFAFEKSFPYQLVSADTQILCFDDVKKNFTFERLFSVITEGLTLEKKNKDAIKIPFKKSPKVAITTNYAIRGSGNSFDRRKHEVELHQYYNKTFTPLGEFERHFFAEWPDDEYLKFDNYMIYCLQSYLDTGLIKGDFVNLKIRKLSADTCHEFIEWCGLINDADRNHLLMTDRKLRLQELYDDFVGMYSDYGPKSKNTVSNAAFYKWMHYYGNFISTTKPKQSRDSQGAFIILYEDPELDPQTKLDI